MKHLISMLVLLSFISSCGHIANPAPQKAELTSSRDQKSTCEEIKSEILYLQGEREKARSKIDTQTGQNVAAAVGGVLFLFPIVFMDVTNDKSDAYHSFVYREEYLRRLATDRNCTDLPGLDYQQGRDTFVASGGNVAQSKINFDEQSVHPSEPWTGKWKMQGVGSTSMICLFKQNAQTVTLDDQNRFKAIGAISGNKLEGTYEILQRDFALSFSLSSDAMTFEGYAADQNGEMIVRGYRVVSDRAKAVVPTFDQNAAGSLLKTPPGDVHWFITFSRCKPRLGTFIGLSLFPDGFQKTHHAACRSSHHYEKNRCSIRTFTIRQPPSPPRRSLLRKVNTI